VVGVGASAGGLKALEAFFGAISPNSGCAYIVVQHLSPDFKSVMDELLAKHTRVPIRIAATGMAPEPNTIYLTPSKMQLSIRDRRLVLADRRVGQGLELPINQLFASLAAEFGPAAVGVVLSGTGSDGTEGVRSIHADGGLVLVQTPETAEFDGMPRNALALGIADYMLPPERMAGAIASYGQNPSLRLPAVEVAAKTLAEAGEFSVILERLQKVSGIDFTPYKLATVGRRIHRRMELCDCPGIEAYERRLAADPAEADVLYHDLLIGVTEFFRDGSAFAALEAQALRPLFESGEREEIRVWCAGCASGEEPYSLAMLIDELARQTGYRGRWSIFATDLHRATLGRASQGVFKAAQVAKLPPERRDRYFTPAEGDQWRVVPALRQNIVFVPHNVLADPPFTKLDVITCRNLLIYFGPAAQERALGLFHYGLRPEGILFLGMSEGVGRLESAFELVDPKFKLFRKSPRVGETRLPFDSVPGSTAAWSLRSGAVPPLAATISRPLLQAYDELLALHAPAGFIVAESGELLHCTGGAGRYLAPESGRTEINLLKRCEGDLRVALATLLASVFKSGRKVSVRAVAIAGGDDARVTDVTAEIVARGKPGQALAFVALSERTEATPAAATPASAPVVEIGGHELLRQRIATLEHELQVNRENLQATVEELQTTNEELQASYEELVASNEELQATNEELHSVNEELHTVNTEMVARNQELRSLNEDLDNLFVSLDVGVLFVDRDLRIRKFNEAVRRIFKLLAHDIGRPLDHISYQLGTQEELFAAVQEVMASGRATARERRTREGVWVLKRIMPYYGSQRTVEGAVLTFNDITEIKRLQSRVGVAIEAAQLVWWEWDLPADRLVTHAAGPCILGYEFAEIPPHPDFWFKAAHPEDEPRIRASLDACLRGENQVWACEYRFRNRSGHWIWVSSRGRVIERDAANAPILMLGTTQDITARKQAEELRFREAEVLARIQDAVICADLGGSVNFANALAIELRAPGGAGVEGRPIHELFPPETQALITQALASAAAGRSEQIEWRDGERWFETHISGYGVGEPPDGAITLTREITARRREAERLRETERQLMQSQKMETLGRLAGGIAHDFNNLLTGILGSVALAEEEFAPNHPGKPHLANVQVAAQRATELVRQILAFSRAGAQEREVIDAAVFLGQILPLLRASLPSTIKIVPTVGDGPLAVLADRSQLQQVIFNLSANAAYAMREHGGQLRIGLSKVTVPQPVPSVLGEITAGPYVCLSVSDEGTGIPADVLPRIFEPFYTTKPSGEGTGLGLSIVHGVVMAHQGRLRVATEANRGTTFEIFLGEADPARLVTASSPLAIEAGKGQLIAVVDDEPIVVEMLRALLRKHGYTPIVFRGAGELLHHIETADGLRPQLIISDQTMPQLTGVEMIRILRERGHLTPVVLTSGYTRGESAEEARLIENVVFVPKPFDRAHLLGVVHRLLQTAVAV